MFKFAHYLVVLPWLLVLPTVGCRPASGPEKPPRKTSAGAKSSARHSDRHEEESVRRPAVRPQAPPLPPPSPPKIPDVVLSDELRAACLVNVGDLMPEAELSDMDGKTRKTSGLYGPKLTVVCFWTIGTTPRSRLVAGAVLRDLMKEVVEPFGERGVRVVAINVGDAAEEAKKYADDAKTTFPNLLDPRGELYAKIALERKMPRTYLLDARGKVLWFDLEYSNTARRDLTLGIEAALDKMK